MFGIVLKRAGTSSRITPSVLGAAPCKAHQRDGEDDRGDSPGSWRCYAPGRADLEKTANEFGAGARQCEEGLAIDLFPAGDVSELARHLVHLLQHRDRQVEMALQNVSAALRMSMPEIIRQYLRTFELRQDLENMRSLSFMRKLPRWLPMRDRLVRRRARKMLLRSEAFAAVAASAAAANGTERAEVIFLATAAPAEADQAKTGTD